MCRSVLIVPWLVVAVAGGTTATAAGPDPRLFTTAASPGAILGVDTPRVVGHLKPFVSIGFDHANDELVAVLNHVRSPLLSHRSTWDFAVGLGVTDRLELALGVPVEAIVGAEGSAVGADVGDVRLRVKARILGDGGPGLSLGVLGELGLPSAGDTAFAGAGGFSGTVDALGTYTLADGPVLALSLGARGRGVARVEGLPIGSELRWGLGIDVPLVTQLALLGEVEGAIGLASPDQYPIEARVGARIHFGKGITLALAGGAGLTHGYGAPDWRVMIGFGWTSGRDEAALATLAPTEVSHSDRLRRPHRPPPDPAHPDPAHPTPSPDTHPLDVTAFDHAADLDPDPDQDGVLGELDNCPSEREDLDGFADVDGCPDPDNDNDGIPDLVDKCPEQPETINGIDDTDGCPDGEAAKPLKLTSPELAKAIVFRSGSDVLEAASEEPLKQIAALLRAAEPDTRVLIEGHTDNEGNSEFNVVLSERRANRVRSFLVAQGVPPERVIAKGFGATHPIAPNKNEFGRAQNRRVVFTPQRSDAHPLGPDAPDSENKP